jgi:hypothetical protein
MVQLRLSARYRKLARTGKPANVLTAAIGQRRGRGRGLENPGNHYLPGRRSNAGC